jgi:hypothetical protein
MPLENSWAMTKSEATDSAFASLLLTPGAEPQNGIWEIPVEKYFQPESEAELIAYLEKMKVQGADFNAYRHFGTLLHHAIRAGFADAAAWLLKNGSDPLKTLKSGDENALDISVRYKRTAITELLVSHYRLQAKPASKEEIVVPARIMLPSQSNFLTVTLPNINQADTEKVREGLKWFGALVRNGSTDANDATNAWLSFEAKLTASDLQKIVDQQQPFIDYLSMHFFRSDSLDATIAKLPRELSRRYMNNAILELTKKAEVMIPPNQNDPPRTYRISTDTWTTLWKYRDGSIDYSKTQFLAARIQPELWNSLFTTGYADRNAESALGCFIGRLGASDFRNLWRDIQRNFPNIDKVAPRLVLNHLRMPAFNYCWSSGTTDTIAKLEFLQSMGITEPVTGLDTFNSQMELSDLAIVMNPFLEAPSTQTKVMRLTEVSKNCKLSASVDWFSELADPEKNQPWWQNPDTGEFYNADGMNFSIDTAQVIPVPGEQECALLAGGSFTQKIVLDPGGHDTFDGPIPPEPHSSCSETPGGYELLILENGKVKHVLTDIRWNGYGERFAAVRDAQTGRHLLVRDEGGGIGMCGGRRQLPGLYALNTSSTTIIERVKDLDLEEALFKQCKLVNHDGLLHCDGFLNDIANASLSGPLDVSYVEFLKQHFPTKIVIVLSAPAEKQAEYQSSLVQLNKEKLEAIKKLGTIPSTWTTEAMRAVASSGLSLTEKRNRVAWLFRDRDALSAIAYDEQLLGELMDWLPREDWNPVLKLLSRPAPALDNLKQLAQGKNLSTLSCEIDHAQGLICGEQISF